MGKFLRNALFGIAVGDALGVPHEKKPRGSFKCLGWDYTPEPNRKRMWSDDTALTLAELDSFGILKKVDFDAVMQNFMRQLPAFFYSLPRGSLKTATVA